MSTVQNANLVRTEFAAAITQIATERKIDPEYIYEAIRQALVSEIGRASCRERV